MKKLSLTRRRFAAASLAGTVPLLAHDDDEPPVITRVGLIHGGTPPLPVAGYRMGEAALKKLKLNRGNMVIEVIHHAPAELQWTSILDGLQAATGASPGKMNLKLVSTTRDKVHSIVRNRKTGESVKLELVAEFVQANLNLPAKSLLAAGAKTSTMPENEIFRMS